MGLPFNESFGALPGALPTPPWTQANLVAVTLNTDGSGHGKASAASATDILAYGNSNTFTNDQSAQVTINAGLASLTNYASVVLRGSGSGASFAGYEIYTDGQTGSTHTELAKFASGSPTVLTNFATTFGAGDVLKATIVGNVITVYKNGVSVGTFTDGGAAPPAGAPGCGVTNTSANNVLLTNFQSDNVPATALGGFYGSARLGPQIGPRDKRGFLPSNFLRYSYAESGVVSNPLNVNPDLGALTLTGFAPAIGLPVTAAPGVGALTLTGFAPTVGLPVTVNPATGALTLTGFAPTIGLPVTVAPGLGQLVLTGFAPTIGLPVTVTPDVGGLTLTGFAPTISVTQALNVLPGTGDLQLTGFAPAIGLPITLAPGLGALVLTGFAPTITTTGALEVVPGSGDMVLTGFAPTVDTGAAVQPTIPDVRIGAGGGSTSGFLLRVAMRAAEARRNHESKPIMALVERVEPIVRTPEVVQVPRHVAQVEPIEVRELESVASQAPVDLGPSLLPDVYVPEPEVFPDSAIDSIRARREVVRQKALDLETARMQMFAPRQKKVVRPVSPVAHAAVLAMAARQAIEDEELAYVLLIAA